MKLYLVMCCCVGYSCSTDYVDLYSLTPRRRSSDTTTADVVTTLDDLEAVQLGHYCGRMLPGPQLSEERSTAMRVIFVSNAVGIKTGFRAKYEFIVKQPLSKRTLSSLILTYSFAHPKCKAFIICMHQIKQNVFNFVSSHHCFWPSLCPWFFMCTVTLDCARWPCDASSMTVACC